MSSSMEMNQIDPISTPQADPVFSASTGFRIKRAGARPLSFQGSELAMAMSYTPSLPYWYEVNIYRTTDQRFAVAIRLFFQSEDEQDTAQAWIFDSIDEALVQIEGYDAAQDVHLPAMPPTEAAADLAVYASRLQAAVSAARHHYASLIGELFYDLEGHA